MDTRPVRHTSKFCRGRKFLADSHMQSEVRHQMCIATTVTIYSIVCEKTSTPVVLLWDSDIAVENQCSLRRDAMNARCLSLQMVSYH